MPEDRVQVAAYQVWDGEARVFTGWRAAEWPAQTVVTDLTETKQEAWDAFAPLYNATKETSLDAADFRYFGPVLATANLREADGGWIAESMADKLYAVAAPTEDEAKAAFVDYFYIEYTKVEPGAFPQPLTDENVDWTYNPNG